MVSLRRRHRGGTRARRHLHRNPWSPYDASEPRQPPQPPVNLPSVGRNTVRGAWSCACIGSVYVLYKACERHAAICTCTWHLVLLLGWSEHAPPTRTASQRPCKTSDIEGSTVSGFVHCGMAHSFALPPAR